MYIKYKISSVFILLLLIIFGCGKNKPVPPNPVYACANIGSDMYNCNTGSAASLVRNGKGRINLSVTSDNPVQFGQATSYLPNNYSTPTIHVMNSTAIHGPHKIVYDKLYFDVPVDDSYVIKVYYIEYGESYPSNLETGNTSTCYNPATGGCYRWYKMISLPSGFVPSCTDNYTIIINQLDPSGFIGNCY